jgi:hypothetical protein
MGSHLSDEVWRVNSEEAVAIPTCGWPFVTVLAEGEAWVPCQEDGDIQVIDIATGETLVTYDVSESFHTQCPDGLCTSHVEFVDATWAGDSLVWSDPYLPGVRWLDGTTLTWEQPTRPNTSPLHLGVRGIDDDIFVYDPRGMRVLRVRDGSFDDEVAASAEPFAFPLLVGDRGLWTRDRAVSVELFTTASLPSEATVVATGENWIVGTEGEDIVVWWEHDLSEQGRMSREDLRVPPLGHRGDQAGAMRYHIAQDDSLVVVNSFRGTLERRTLPDLVALGSDEVRALGTWSDLPDVR